MLPPASENERWYKNWGQLLAAKRISSCAWTKGDYSQVKEPSRCMCWVGLGLGESLGWCKLCSPVQCRFIFGHVRWSSTQEDGTHLLAIWMEGSTHGQWWLFLQPSSWNHTTQYLTECFWCLSSTVPLPKPKVNACVQVRLCVGHLRGCLGLNQPSVSPRQIESLLIFTARSCNGLFFLHWFSGFGSQV